MELLIFGARNYANPAKQPAWNLYEAALMLKVQGRSQSVDRLEYPGSEIEREVGISVCFKAATIEGDHAYTCTSTELLDVDLSTLRILNRTTHRWFNDLHHVAKIDNAFYVADTGADSVLEFDAGWSFVRRHVIGDDALVKKHGEDTDYRRIPTTKPHFVHPNYVAAWDGRVWVTNHEGGCVQTLTGSPHVVGTTLRPPVSTTACPPPTASGLRRSTAR